MFGSPTKSSHIQVRDARLRAALLRPLLEQPDLDPDFALPLIRKHAGSSPLAWAAKPGQEAQRKMMDDLQSTY